MTEFCPEPPKHIGQPPVFDLDDDDTDEDMADYDPAMKDYTWPEGLEEGHPQLRMGVLKNLFNGTVCLTCTSSWGGSLSNIFARLVLYKEHTWQHTY